MSSLSNSHVRGSKGFTLIEVLVALVVLSIGLLGVAALQLMSLRSNHGSAMRTQATFLAYDIVDRMRANRDDALAGRYRIALGNPGAGGTLPGDDLVAWKRNIRQILPAISPSDPADGSVTDNNGVFTVTIRWADWDDTGAAARTPITFTMTTRLLD